MGSNQSANRLAINSMSKVVHFSRDELMALQKQFGKLAHGSENAHTVNRAQFHEALEIVGLHEKDKEILDRLFTLFDESGDGQVNFKEFVVGVSTVLRGTIEEKLTCECPVPCCSPRLAVPARPAAGVRGSAQVHGRRRCWYPAHCQIPSMLLSGC